MATDYRKCPECNLINDLAVKVCERCGFSLAEEETKILPPKIESLPIEPERAPLFTPFSDYSKSAEGRPLLTAIEDFFIFRRMITPTLIQALYVIGVALITLFGLLFILAPFLSEPPAQTTRSAELARASDFIKGVFIFSGIGIIVLGNIVWRLVCEWWVVFFSMHETLMSIEKAQLRQSRGNSP